MIDEIDVDDITICVAEVLDFIAANGIDKINTEIAAWKVKYNHVEYWACILRCLSTWENQLSAWKPLLEETEQRIRKEVSEEAVYDMLFGMVERAKTNIQNVTKEVS